LCFFNRISVFFISLGKNKIYDTKDLIGKDIGTFQLTSWSDNKKINEEFLKENKFTLIKDPLYDHTEVLFKKSENN